MRVDGGEAAQTNLAEVPIKSPFFPLMCPSMGGEKVLSVWFRKRILKKKGYLSIVILPDFFPRNVLFDGVGWTVHQKGPLVFFVLRYIKHYIHIKL